MRADTGPSFEASIIPAKVSGKFSIRLVPPQIPENVGPLVVKYLHDEFAKFGSKDAMIRVENTHGGKPWVENHKHWNYEAAYRVTEVTLTLTATQCQIYPHLSPD